MLCVFRRASQCLLLLLIVLSNGQKLHAQQEDVQAETVPTSESPAPITGPRELFEALRVGESHFRSFIDGQPVGPGDQESLMRVLLRLPEFPLGKIESWMRRDLRPEALLQTPEQYRGQILLIRGRVKQVTVEQPLPEIAQRFGISEYYRCEAVTESGDPVVIYTRDVPDAWEVDEPIDYAFSSHAFFLKLGDEREGKTETIFAARSIAWHPDTVLGLLGMDYGLLDTVVNRKPLADEESEAFYHMLRVVNGAGVNELRRRVTGEQQLVPMLLKPEEQHGKLALIEGTARSAVKVLIHDADMAARMGFDHYYQVVVFVDLGQPVVMNETRFNNYPFTVCVLELPAGMPTGEKINEQVSVPAFFYKLWTYRSQLSTNAGQAERQPSPLLIGKQLQWIVPERSGSGGAFGLMIGGIFVLTIAGLWIGVWRVNRSDEEFHRRTIAPLQAADPNRSLNEIGLESRDKPDFTNL